MFAINTAWQATLKNFWKNPHTSHLGWPSSVKKRHSEELLNFIQKTIKPINVIFISKRAQFEFQSFFSASLESDSSYRDHLFRMNGNTKSMFHSFLKDIFHIPSLKPFPFLEYQASFTSRNPELPGLSEQLPNLFLGIIPVT